MLLKKATSDIEDLNKQFSDTRILYLNNKDKIEQLDKSIFEVEQEIKELQVEKEKTDLKIQEYVANIKELEELEEELLKQIEEYTQLYHSENRDIEKLNEREQNLSNEERELLKDKSKLETDLLHARDRFKKNS